jgi:molybdate transport system substrate-binding protein
MTRLRAFRRGRTRQTFARHTGGLACIVVAAMLSLPPLQAADQITVLTSGGLAAALQELVPALQRVTGSTVAIAEGATVNNGPTSIPSRLRRGDVVDVVVMSATGLQELIVSGQIAAGSRVDLAQSGIGMAVRAGAPKPDISSVDALKRTLLNAASVAVSTSISGVYIEQELFPRLGIADQMKSKTRRYDERVGAVVARGDAALGFQQVSELKPMAGIDYVGPLPVEVQRVTVFAAGIASSSVHRDAARQAVAFLASESASAAIAKSGLEPVTR